MCPVFTYFNFRQNTKVMFCQLPNSSENRSSHDIDWSLDRKFTDTHGRNSKGGPTVILNFPVTGMTVTSKGKLWNLYLWLLWNIIINIHQSILICNQPIFADSLIRRCSSSATGRVLDFTLAKYPLFCCL